jgi:hypothetical protein
MSEIVYSKNEEEFSYDDIGELLNDLVDDWDDMPISDNGYSVVIIWQGELYPMEAGKCIHAPSLADCVIDNIYETTDSDWFEFECSHKQQEALEKKLKVAVSEWEKEQKIKMPFGIKNIKELKILCRIKIDDDDYHRVLWYNDITDLPEHVNKKVQEIKMDHTHQLSLEFEEEK